MGKARKVPTGKPEELVVKVREWFQKEFQSYIQDGRSFQRLEWITDVLTAAIQKASVGDTQAIEKIVKRCPPLEVEEDPFTEQELAVALKKTKDTAPGVDGLRYHHLEWFDPDHRILTPLYNECKEHRKIPSHWKEAETILLYKGGDESKPENWRPISLMPTIYKLYSSHKCLKTKVKILAFADDMAILSDSKKQLQEELERMDDDCTPLKLIFKPSKCASLIIEKGKVRPEAQIMLKGEPIRNLAPKDTYKYLGVQTGVETRISELELLTKVTKELEKVNTSDLTPPQKLDCVKAFVLPKLTYMYANSVPKMTELGQFANMTMRAVKVMHSIPVRGSPLEYIQIPTSKGGLGVACPRITAEITFLVSTMKKLWSSDQYIQRLYREYLEEVTRIETGKDQVTLGDLAAYLSNEIPIDKKRRSSYPRPFRSMVPLVGGGKNDAEGEEKEQKDVKMSEESIVPACKEYKKMVIEKHEDAKTILVRILYPFNGRYECCMSGCITASLVGFGADDLKYMTKHIEQKHGLKVRWSYQCSLCSEKAPKDSTKATRWVREHALSVHKMVAKPRIASSKGTGKKIADRMNESVPGIAARKKDPKVTKNSENVLKTPEKIMKLEQKIQTRSVSKHLSALKESVKKKETEKEKEPKTAIPKPKLASIFEQNDARRSARRSLAAALKAEDSPKVCKEAQDSPKVELTAAQRVKAARETTSRSSRLSIQSRRSIPFGKPPEKAENASDALEESQKVVVKDKKSGNSGSRGQEKEKSKEMKVPMITLDSDESLNTTVTVARPRRFNAWCLEHETTQEAWLADDVIMYYMTALVAKTREYQIIDPVLWAEAQHGPNYITGMMLGSAKYFFPICEGNHWILVVMDKERLWYANSLGHEPTGKVKSFIEKTNKKRMHFDVPVPLQKDYVNCGVHVCLIAKSIMESEYWYSEDDVKTFRGKVKEMLRKEGYELYSERYFALDKSKAEDWEKESMEYSEQESRKEENMKRSAEDENSVLEGTIPNQMDFPPPNSLKKPLGKIKWNLPELPNYSQKDKSGKELTVPNTPTHAECTERMADGRSEDVRTAGPERTIPNQMENSLPVPPVEHRNKPIGVSENESETRDELERAKDTKKWSSMNRPGSDYGRLDGFIMLKEQDQRVSDVADEQGEEAEASGMGATITNQMELSLPGPLAEQPSGLMVISDTASGPTKLDTEEERFGTAIGPQITKLLVKLEKEEVEFEKSQGLADRGTIQKLMELELEPPPDTVRKKQEKKMPRPPKRKVPEGVPDKLVVQVREWFEKEFQSYLLDGRSFQRLEWISDVLTAAIQKASDGKSEDIEHIRKRCPPPEREEGDMCTQTETKKRLREKRRKSGDAPKVDITPMRDLYFQNRSRAYNRIVGNTSKQCEIPMEKLEEHFKGTTSETNVPREVLEEKCWKLPKLHIGDWIGEKFSAKEVKEALNKTKDTAPGVDGLRYHHLKWFDPDLKLLTQLYNECKWHQKIPTHWKEAETILLYKGGEEMRADNWRPISLMPTVYKLYSSLWNRRIRAVEGVMSKCQRGFQEREGCAESIAILRTAIDVAKGKRRDLSVAWLDLTNAFGSVPHELIEYTLVAYGFPEEVVKIVMDMYNGASIRVKSRYEKSEPILIKSGVKQGDPISPTLFNMCLESIIRKHLATAAGHQCLGTNVKVLAFADDMAILAESREQLQRELLKMDQDCTPLNLIFKPSKCASLIIEKGKVNKQFDILLKDQAIRNLSQADTYKYLGVQTGLESRTTALNLLISVSKELEKVTLSDLEQHQKLDCVKSFVLPKLTYFHGNSMPKLQELSEFSTVTMRAVKMFHGIPIRGSPREYVQLPISKGGLGVQCPKISALIAFLVSTMKRLWSDDQYIKRLYTDYLREAAETETGINKITVAQIARYLSDDMKVDRKAFGYNSFSRIREVCRNLCKNKDAPLHEFRVIEQNGKLAISVQATRDSKVNVYTEEHMKKLHLYLKSEVNAGLLYKFNVVKPVKSAVCRVIQQHPQSNRFVRTGGKVSFAAKKWIHRARLNLLTCNYNSFANAVTKECRRCGYENESQWHILQTCKFGLPKLITERHDAVLFKVKKLIEKGSKSEWKMSIDQIIPGPTLLRPDICLWSPDKKHVIMADVKIPYENGIEAMERGWNEKVDKYEKGFSYLKKCGKTLKVLPIIVGTMGTWWSPTSKSLVELGIAKSTVNRVIPEICALVMEYSKNCYWNHIFGNEYKHVPFKFGGEKPEGNGWKAIRAEDACVPPAI
ncbi:unnamed protein product [Caenorhabditis sp. 36 PRJEB53466]|nr:unnamed protein product [Caenorhabditis sp. 36 PRJEB53466]